jgi:hypothetical protein
MSLYVPRALYVPPHLRNKPRVPESPEPKQVYKTPQQHDETAFKLPVPESPEPKQVYKIPHRRDESAFKLPVPEPSIKDSEVAKIKPIKSCKGNIEFEKYIYRLVELLRNVRYDEEQKSAIENIYYQDFFKSLEVIRTGNIITDFCDDNKTPYVICHTYLDNIVNKKEVVEEHDKKGTKSSFSKSSFYCKAEGKDDEKEKNLQYPYSYRWFDNLKTEIVAFTKLLPSKQQKDIFNEFFIEETSEYLIVPNIVAYDEPFDQNKIKAYEIFLIYPHHTTIHNIYEFLSTIKFAYFIKEKGKNESIFDLTLLDVHFLEMIKQNIYAFIRKLFGTFASKFDEHNCLITLVADQGNEYFFVNFIIFDRFTITKYSSYNETSKNINIDDAIYNLSKGVGLIYYFNSNKDLGDGKCEQLKPKQEIIKTEPEVPVASPVELEEKKKQPVALPAKPVASHVELEEKKEQPVALPAKPVASPVELLEKIKANARKIKLISSSEPLDKYHSYCSLTIIIGISSEISSEFVDEYYKVSIKSITFNELNTNKDFKKEYLDRIIAGTYTDMGNSNMALLKLPACVRITIKKMLNDNVDYSYHVMETAYHYKTNVLKRIREDVNIKTPLILRFTCLKMYENYRSIQKLCMSIPAFAFPILGEIARSPNFIIYPKVNKLMYLFYFYHVKEQVTIAQFRDKFNEIMCSDNDLRKIKIDDYIKKLGLVDASIIELTIFMDLMKVLIKDTAVVYQIWFIHPGLGMEEEKLSGLLTHIKDNMYNKSKPMKELSECKLADLMSIGVDIKPEILPEFYELFRKEEHNFLYNLRHLQKTHIDEIIKILADSKLQNMIPVMHYPNDDFLNIFHIQIFPIDYSSEDMTGSQNEISISRGYLFNKYKNVPDNYFMDRDIDLTFKINAKKGLTYDELKEKNEYKILKDKYKIARPEAFP